MTPGLQPQSIPPTAVPAGQPAGIPPVMSSDEILGHVDRALSSLPPEAQAAVSHAHSLAGLSQPEMLGTTGGTSQPESIPPVAQTPSSSEPINGPVSIPPETPTHGGPSDEMEIPPESATPEAPNQPQSIPPVSTSENGEIADLDRAQPSNSASAIGQPARIPSAAQAELKRRETTGSGVSQIKSPWARIPLQIADAVVPACFPVSRNSFPVHLQNTFSRTYRKQKDK